MPQNVWDINLDYESINAETTCFSSGSLIHPYPAKAMPNMVSDLLQIISKNYNIKNVLDPFCGSGTVGLESKLLGLDFYGSDLNPLAVLISKTKTLTIENKRYLQRNIEGLVASIKNGGYPTYPLLDFSNIDYWFKAENILELSHLKYAIDNFLKFKGKYKKVYALILLTAYSSTVRDVCLSRNGEFKLYRIPESEIKNWKVDTYLTYEKKLNNLFNLLTETSNQRYNSKAVIEQANAKKINYLRPKSIDLVLTSPPYGDSRSTVAYGQFSRLPIQCIGDLLKKYLDIQTVEANCDELLLGGKKSIIKNKDIIRESALSNSTSLRKLMNSIDETIMFETLNLNAIIKELRVLKEQADIQIISKNKLVINKLKSLVKYRNFSISQTFPQVKHIVDEILLLNL
jgi:DNA modification methylase